MAGDRSRTIAAGAGRMCTGQVCDVVAYARRSGGIAKADIDRFDQANRNRGESARIKPGAIECDEVLFEHLRALRRQLADERGVPAYIIFSDVSLREMARKYPTNSTEFRRIPGVGEQKLKDFGEAFLSAIRSHSAENHNRNILKRCRFYVPKPGGLA